MRRNEGADCEEKVKENDAGKVGRMGKEYGVKRRE